MKKIFFALLRVLISFSLLGLLFWLMRGELQKIWATLLTSDFRYIIMALCLFVINVSILSYRLKIVFEGENLRLSWWNSLQLTYIGYFFNNFMPTAVGGDVIKAHYATYTNQRRMQSYASVLMDRMVGLYSFLIIAAVALVINWRSFPVPAVRKMIFLLLFIGVSGFLIVTNKIVANWMEGLFRRLKMFRLGERLKVLYGIVYDYRNRRNVIVKAILMSMLAQSIYFVIIYLFFLSLGKNLNILNIFLIMPVVTFISMMPSLGGLGLREGAIVAFFAPLAGRDSAFAVSLLLLFGFFVISFIGGIVYLWWGFAIGRKEPSK